MPEYTIILKLKDDDPKTLEVHVDWSKEYEHYYDVPTAVWKGAAMTLGEIWEKCENRM